MFLGIAHIAHNAHTLRQLVMRCLHGISRVFGPGRRRWQATLAGDAGRRRWQATLAGAAIGPLRIAHLAHWPKGPRHAGTRPLRRVH